MIFVEVIIPLPLPQYYTYSVPDEMAEEVELGKRVLVQFGRKKFYAAIVRKVHSQVSEGISYKPIQLVLDKIPVVSQTQMEFWEWVANYYMCTAGEVMQFAIPSQLRIESKTRILSNPNFEAFDKLTEEESNLLIKVTNEVAYLHDFGVKLMHTLRSLIKKQAILFIEEIEDKTPARKEKFVRLSPQAADEAFLNSTLDKLVKAPKQKEILEAYLRLSDAFGDSPKPRQVSQKILLEMTQGSYPSLKNLIDKGILETYSLSDWEVEEEVDEKSNLPILAPDQQRALEEINQGFEKKSVVLLHGITGSGKTEIYFHLIADVLQKGQQVLYLLPEIAITYQIIKRLKSVFGNRVFVYHSRISARLRMETYYRVHYNQSTEGQVIIGVRSSVFLPFSNLGLIIVDEEHENSYKQYEPAPRYNARDTAIKLASLLNAKVLLGSATPAVESYYNASIGKYGLVKLKERYRGIELPKMELVNMVAAQRKGKVQSHFSQILLNEIQQCLDENKQVLLFHNRRGFSPYIQCNNCKYIFRCRNCDVSLTYHKLNQSLTCHYCGFSIVVPTVCPQCASTDLKIRGYGTEKVEEELAIFFPDARIGRLDQDVARSRDVFDEIIGRLENGELDIVVGTQMISKGLDLARVELVGILDADSLLNYPDFRASERSFQLIVQVGGRAGRRNKQGKVIIQTYMPEHPIVQMALRHDYEAMYRLQLSERQTFHYPPFVRMIHLSIQHANEQKCEEASQMLFRQLQQKLHHQVLSPQKPIIARMFNLYLRDIYLKINPATPLTPVKKYLLECIAKIKSTYSTVNIVIDVDPQ
ncbi:MAG: primosomal protein N' [Bacteroidales bacterium]|nr:primosomal protein N' [Bacteroidales bacterium]